MNKIYIHSRQRQQRLSSCCEATGAPSFFTGTNSTSLLIEQSENFPGHDSLLHLLSLTLSRHWLKGGGKIARLFISWRPDISYLFILCWAIFQLCLLCRLLFSRRCWPCNPFSSSFSLNVEKLQSAPAGWLAG